MDINAELLYQTNELTSNIEATLLFAYTNRVKYTLDINYHQKII